MLSLANLKNNKNRLLFSYLKQLGGIRNEKGSIILNDIGVGRDIRLQTLDQIYSIHIFQWLNDNNFNLNSDLKYRLKKKQLTFKYKFFTHNFYKDEFN